VCVRTLLGARVRGEGGRGGAHNPTGQANFCTVAAATKNIGVQCPRGAAEREEKAACEGEQRRERTICEVCATEEEGWKIKSRRRRVVEGRR
jgi:hypothetical protein